MDDLLISNVGVRFDGLWANKNISFAVDSGSITAVIGPNGAGKSTLFNVISGFIRPSEGHVKLGGTTISGMAADCIARQGIARTFQIPEVCGDLTLFENVLVGAHRHIRGGLFGQIFGIKAARISSRVAGEQVSELLATANLWSIRDQLAQTLPLGKVRLLEICRALASRPSILLLDEAASGLNSQEAQELARFLQTLPRQGITVVLIEHNIRFVMDLAQKIAVLNFGKLISLGTPEEVRNSEAVVSAYLGHGSPDAKR
jgi:branched-chain amino acid transport system ATP-binding protein